MTGVEELPKNSGEEVKDRRLLRHHHTVVAVATATNKLPIRVSAVGAAVAVPLPGKMKTGRGGRNAEEAVTDRRHGTHPVQTRRNEGSMPDPRHEAAFVNRTRPQSMLPGGDRSMVSDQQQS